MHLGAGVGAAVGVSVLRGQGVGLPTVKVSFWPGVRKEICYLNLSEFHLFKNHPFGVLDDAEMQGLVVSVADGYSPYTSLLKAGS